MNFDIVLACKNQDDAKKNIDEPNNRTIPSLPSKPYLQLRNDEQENSTNSGKCNVQDSNKMDRLVIKGNNYQIKILFIF